MKNWTEWIAVLIVLVMLAPALVFAQGSAWRSEDDSAPFAIKVKTDDTVKAYVDNTANVFSLTNSSDTAANVSVTLTPSTDVDDIVSDIESATNSNGRYVYDAMVWEALSTDTVSNKMVAGNVTLVNHEWDVQTEWDTSACLFYSCIPDEPVSDNSAPGGYRITGILGDPGGTGDVTVRIYQDNTLAYQATIESPVYTTPQVVNYTGTVTNVTVDQVTLGGGEVNLGSGVWIGGGKRGVVKVTRGTTATTGGIGVTIGR